MNPISLAPLASADASPVEQVVAAAEAGFRAMGLRLAPPNPRFDVIADRPLRREVAAALRGTGMRLLETGNVRLAPGDDPLALRPLLDAGAELGGEHILVTGTDAIERLVEFPNFELLCRLCSQAGLRPMIEFVSYRSIATLDQARAIIENAGSTDAGICVDPLHLCRSGSHPDALRGLDPAFLPYAHFCDARVRRLEAATPAALQEESVRDRLYPGEGALWLDEFVAALPAGIPLNVEAPHRQYSAATPLARAKAAFAATRRFLERHYTAAAHSAR